MGTGAASDEGRSDGRAEVRIRFKLDPTYCDCKGRWTDNANTRRRENAQTAWAAISKILVNGQTVCVVKGDGPQRELNPPGNWFAPPGSNQSSSGGNETAEASGAEGRLSDSASLQAVT